MYRRDYDEQYISGVYNYCDRWCERCPLIGLRRATERAFPRARLFVRPGFDAIPDKPGGDAGEESGR